MWELHYAGKPICTLVSREAVNGHLANIMEILDSEDHMGLYEIRGDDVSHWIVVGPGVPIAVVAV